MKDAWQRFRAPFLVMAACVLLVGSGPFVAAQAPPATQPALASVQDDRPPEYARPSQVPAEVLNPRKPQAVILPSTPNEQDLAPDLRSTGVVAAVAPTQRLLPEGYAIADRPAHFAREEGWWVVRLDRVPGLPTAPPIRILPNRQLTLLERVLGEADATDTFKVTGRITEFLGANYLLLERISSTQSAETPAPAPSAEPAAAAEANAEPASPPTAQEIIEQLTKEAPGRMIRRAPETRSARNESTSAPASGAATLPEGTLLAEFPGRLIRAGAGWTIMRETRSERGSTETYPLLPNRLLETIVASSEGGTRSMIFLVSGELTEYRGQNHLLLRKVLIRRDLGNIR